MKISIFALLVGAATVTNAFVPNSRSAPAIGVSSLGASYLEGLQGTGTSSSPFMKPERVVLEQLPTLYVYDHCPFCVRVRLAFGVKNIKHNLVFMANDDVPTPTALVGKKIAPIFVSS